MSDAQTGSQIQKSASLPCLRPQLEKRLAFQDHAGQVSFKFEALDFSSALAHDFPDFLEDLHTQRFEERLRAHPSALCHSVVKLVCVSDGDLATSRQLHVRP